MLRLLICVAMVTAFVVSIPNVYEYEYKHEEIQEMVDTFKTREELWEYLSASHDTPGQPLKLQSFSWKDCGGVNELVNINAVSVTPDPLVIPGPVFVETQFKINTDLKTPLPGNLLMEKKILGKWIKIPCVDIVGSCHYDNLCDLLGKLDPAKCPDSIKRLGNNCTCPFAPGSYSLPKSEFDITFKLPVPKGDYHIVANITYSGKESTCLDMILTFA